MGVYRRPDSPTWWMSLQVEHRRVRLNTGVDDRRLAEEIFAAWKVEVARERWLGPRPADQQFMVADLIDKYLTLMTPRKGSSVVVQRSSPYFNFCFSISQFPLMKYVGTYLILKR